jgi:hypothetical protein
MPRNITSMDVAALKGPAGMATCGAEALSSLTQDSEAHAAQEPEPEPELGTEGQGDTLPETFLRAEALFHQICGSSLPSIDPGLQKLVKQCLGNLSACRSKVPATLDFSLFLSLSLSPSLPSQSS